MDLPHGLNTYTTHNTHIAFSSTAQDLDIVIVDDDDPVPKDDVPTYIERDGGACVCACSVQRKRERERGCVPASLLITFIEAQRSAI